MKLSAFLALVLVGGALSLLATQAGSASQTPTINPADFSATIDNPLFPLSTTSYKVFEGTETDPDTGEVVIPRLESRVLPEKTRVAGVEVLILEERAYADGQLIELALDYFAQHKDGSVYYFGELVDNYEDGKLLDHNGTWLSGEGANQPGIVMPKQPKVGEVLVQENAPGIAEDTATVVSTTESVTVTQGSYKNCVKTRDVNPLDPEAVHEFKFYCPGVGLVREESVDGNEVLNLISVERPAAAPAAAPTAAPAAPRPAMPVAGFGAPNTGGSAFGGSHHAAVSLVSLAALGLAFAVLGAARLARGPARRD
jgi:hypothetical protein